jgi:hypothetical protein
MSMPAADLEDVDIVKKWHNDPKSQVTDMDKGVQRLAAYVDSRSDEEVDVDVYGPANEAGQREHWRPRRRRRRREGLRGSRYGK